MTRNRRFMRVALPAAILIAALLMRGGTTELAEAATESAHAATPPPSAAMAVLRKKMDRMLAERRDASPIANGGTAEFSEELVNAAGQVFHDMEAVGGFVHTRSMRDELADRLLAMPRSLELLGRILTEPSFARSTFGEQQAEARFYAIMALGRAAERGDGEPLTMTAKAVADALAAARDFDRGRMADLRDLVETYAGTRAKGQVGIPELRGLGYAPTHPKALRDVYAEALLQAAWKNEDFFAARSYVQGLLPDG